MSEISRYAIVRSTSLKSSILTNSGLQGIFLLCIVSLSNRISINHILRSHVTTDYRSMHLLCCVRTGMSRQCNFRRRRHLCYRCDDLHRMFRLCRFTCLHRSMPCRLYHPGIKRNGERVGLLFSSSHSLANRSAAQSLI